jgi:hypothetical protein
MVLSLISPQSLTARALSLDLPIMPIEEILVNKEVATFLSNSLVQDFHHFRTHFAFVRSRCRIPTGKRVKTITFESGRYGKNKCKLVFKAMCSPEEAIVMAENVLSLPMSHELFAKLESSNDLFPGTLFSQLAVRGDALGNCMFLETVREKVDEKKERHLELICGS